MRALQLGVLIALFAGFDAGATSALQDHQQLWTPQRMTAEVQARVAALRAAVGEALARQQGARVLALLEAESDPLVRQWVAHEALLSLAGSLRSEAGERLRDWAARQPLIFLRRHEETAADWFQPLIDLAADARALERGWREQEQRDDWARRWQQDPLAGLKALDRAAADEQARAAEALALLDAGAFQRWRDAAGALPPDRVPVALWLAAAHRSVDAQAVTAVLAAGDGEARLAALDLLQSWPDAVAMPLLEQKEADAELASAATIALVPRLLALDPASPAVLARLADPTSRDSASAALARMPETEAAGHLRRLWSAAKSAAQRDGLRHAALIDARPTVGELAKDWQSSGEQP